jgi:hypothetical protein
MISAVATLGIQKIERANGLAVIANWDVEATAAAQISD